MEKLLIETPEEGREAYETPKCEIIEMQSEGPVLSGSYTGGHEGFEEETYPIYGVDTIPFI